MEYTGLETMVGLAGEPPKTISISYSIMHSEELLRQAWNTIYIAILPYCFKCKVPLVWHSPPDNNVLFHCPDCKRQWVKDKDWQAKEKEALLGHSNIS